jgi:hypothetical protein
MDPVSLGVMGAVGLGGSIYGAIQAGQERKRMDRFLSGMKADNQSWYDSNFYGSYIDRADTQQLIKSMREQMDRRSKIDQSTAAITGATPEATTVAKENANKVMTDTYSRVAALGQQYKDSVTDKYMNQKNALSQAELNAMDAKAQSYENIASNSMGSALQGITSALIKN